MHEVDLLSPAARMRVSGSPEVATLVQTFNAMTERLETERRTSGTLALAAQEAERTRIALSLHDSIGQSLTAVLLHLKRIADRAPESLQAELEYAQEAARESLDEVRRVATELRPPELDALGLVPALATLAQKIERSSGLVVEQRFCREPATARRRRRARGLPGRPGMPDEHRTPCGRETSRDPARGCSGQRHAPGQRRRHRHAERPRGQRRQRPARHARASAVRARNAGDRPVAARRRRGSPRGAGGFRSGE